MYNHFGYTDEDYDAKTERTRRYSKIVTHNIDFKEETNASIDHDFLKSNYQNKTYFMHMLMENDFKAKQAEDDADTLMLTQLFMK